MEMKLKDADNTFSMMDGFLKGMGSITLFPQLLDIAPDVSPWQGRIRGRGDMAVVAKDGTGTVSESQKDINHGRRRRQQREPQSFMESCTTKAV
jgi:hypothetical protein